MQRSAALITLYFSWVGNVYSLIMQEINHAGVGGLDPELVSNRGEKIFRAPL
jgi:hypothetical protein